MSRRSPRNTALDDQILTALANHPDGMDRQELAVNIGEPCALDAACLAHQEAEK